MLMHIQGVMRHWLVRASFCASLALSAGVSLANDRHLAPGFQSLPAGAKVVVMPVDVELFSLSAGGVAEPKADWTASALEHIRTALNEKSTSLGIETLHIKDQDADEFGEQMSLHAAVARSISLHHSMGGAWALPSKEGKLDWTFEDAMKGIQTRTGARYGLFTWVRDSYASAERVATMILMAALGVGVTGGAQVGYASLVDLETGQVLWFNQMLRGTGDLREAGPAAESVQVLLSGFPKAQ